MDRYQSKSKYCFVGHMFVGKVPETSWQPLGQAATGAKSMLQVRRSQNKGYHTVPLSLQP